jgi:hypothetical protein
LTRRLRSQIGSIWRGLMDGAFAIATIQLILHLTKSEPLPAHAAEPLDETSSTESVDGTAQIALLEDALVFADVVGAAADGDKVPFPAFLPQDEFDLEGWPVVSADGAEAVDLMLRAPESNFDISMGFKDQQASILV